MRPISADKKNAAVQLLSQGLSIRKVAMQVGIGAATVGRIARNMPHRVGIRGGRPCLLSDTDNQKITRDITTGNYDTAVQVTCDGITVTRISRDQVTWVIRTSGEVSAHI
jgi:transposase